MSVEAGAVRAGRGGEMPRVSPKARVSPFVPRIVAGSLFVAVTVVIAAVAAWPIYRSGAMLLLAGVVAVVAAGIAVIAWRRRWPAWLISLALVGAFFLFGVPLAVPARLGGIGEFVRGLGDLAVGAVFAWKDLLTVDLPVGSYRNLLVPALIVFLVGTCAALLLSWREDRAAYAAAPLALGMVAFGLFFGRTSVSAPWHLGPVTFYAPVETAIGISALIGTLLWLAWRSRDERVHALQRAAASSGVRVTRRPSRADQRRGALGAAMLVVAVVATAAVVPFAARGADREVLRSAVIPEIDLSAEVSPLTSYRTLFENGVLDEVLFTVGAGRGGAMPERVRLATLDNYDGEIFRAGGSGGIDAARFVRVPSTLDAGDGGATSIRITVDALDGIWLPTAGQLESISFGGERTAALADRFYYSAGAQAGVETAGGGVTAGDTYEVTAVQPNLPDLASIQAPGGISEDVAAPENLKKWVEANVSGSDGEALAGLVTLLRERGYLSHGLDVEGTDSEWVQSIPDYRPQPSASGHSLARIDTLFRKLLEREADPRAQAAGNFVAAIGDDEQFSVAVALVARELGFPSRVVVGARLSSDDPSLASCVDGACRAQDMVAWTEVQSSEGDWVPVDVTPQYANSPSLDLTEQQDPKVVTDVRPDTVEEVVPPDPLQEDSAADDDDARDSGPDLAWLWPILRIAGIVLLVLLLAFGPFLVVIIAKATRRRARRRQDAPAARVAGGWDEYVDAAVDSGRPAPAALTRSELATSFETAEGSALASGADRAVFSDATITLDEAEAFWSIVEEERRALRGGGGFWRTLAATVSLRSFVRHLAPVGGARKRFAEKGKRGATGSARTSQ